MALLYKTDLAIDVGANVGQWAQMVRASGYKGRILSFEPLSDAYALLKDASSEDPNWSIRNCALGTENGHVTINVANNSMSSSLLGFARDIRSGGSDVRMVGQETVQIAALDHVDLPNFRFAYLKADVQGAELRVLGGGEVTLRRVAAVELEVSLVPIYESQPLFHEVVSLLRERGFVLVHLEPAFTDEASGELMQLDAIFTRVSTHMPTAAGVRNLRG